MTVLLILIIAAVLSLGRVQGMSPISQNDCTLRIPSLSSNDRPPCSSLMTLKETGDHSRTYGSHVARVTCQLPTNLDTITLSVCILPQGDASIPVYYWLDEDVKWTLRVNDSVVLTRQPSTVGPLALNLKFNWTSYTEPSVRYSLYNIHHKSLFHETIKTGYITLQKDKQSHIKIRKRRDTSATASSGYLVVANRLYLHQISTDGSRINVVVGGLNYAIAVDFHFRNNSLYWIDSGHQAIVKSTLQGLKRIVVLDHGLTEPEDLSIDWINNKLYWTDVQERRIGVLDLFVEQNYKYNLLSSGDNLSPRGIAVDPTTRTLYWTEWGTRAANGRVNRASMDGTGKQILHQTNLQQPYGITIDVDTQVIYWADVELQRVEMSNADGSNRRVVVSSGVERPYSLSVHGDILYISDWNRRVLATNKTGGQPVHLVNDTFCTYLSTFGVQVIAEEKQLLVTNPCAVNNGGCSHMCLLSSSLARGYSCVCPEAMSLGVDGLTCSQTVVNTTSIFTRKGSCEVAGYTGCCTTGMCWGTPSNCFCDTDCYQYGDCCNDIEDTCSSTQTEGSNAFLLLANTLYIHRISTDGVRNRTLYSSAKNIIAIDYNYRTNHMYWSTSNGNGLWRSELDGSGAIALLTDNVQTVDDIAVDWISSKLYWTDSGPANGIKVLDLALGHTATVIDTGPTNRPRAIVVDPINKWMYWTSSTKIEKASMDGENRTILHSTGLQQPYGLTIDYAQPISSLYWIDASLDRIEASTVDGSNRRVITSDGVYSPFGLSVYRGTLYYTDEGIYSVSINGGVATTIFDSTCTDTVGIEVVSIERQLSGTNPCQLNNGGCSHLCILSSMREEGYSCSCPDGFNLGNDARTCSSNGTTPATEAPALEHGTCVAAGYTGGCCTSGACQGSPPTCSCDSTCVVFQDCCIDVPPSCQPAIDVLEFFNVTTNLTVVLGTSSQPVSQFYCSVRASRVTNFEWTYSRSVTNEFSNVQPTFRVINNAVGTLDAQYNVISTDYSSVLTVEDVEFSDAGNYTCGASIGDRINPISSITILTVQVYPSLLEILGSNQYYEGQTIHLQCQLEVFPPPTAIVWIIRDLLSQSRVLQSTSRISISSTHSFIDNGQPMSRSELYISHVTVADSGDYICVIESNITNHAAMHMTAHNINVTSIDECERSLPVCLNGATCIDYEAGYQCLCANDFTGENCSQRIDMSISLSAPMFVSTSIGTLSNNLGDAVNLTCLAEGRPSPSYEWFRDSMVINGETRSYLFISEALPSDRGNYSCRASNSEGEISSNIVQLTLQGVSQYLVVLECNQTCYSNFSEEISTVAISLLLQYLDRHQNNIYSVEEKSQTNFSDIHLLVTILQTQLLSQLEIRRVLRSALANIGPVKSLTRYDGCELDDRTELDIGDIAIIPCPCQEYLPNMLIDGQEGWRRCGGSYRNGAQIEETDFSQCVTFTDDFTNILCRAVMGIQEGRFVDQSLKIVNITSNFDIQMRSTVDITLLSVIVELLTEEAMINSMVRDNYLVIVDHFQRISSDAHATSQSVANSSTRVLNSLEQFAAGVNINSSDSEEKFIFQTFGIVLVDVIPEEFHGHTFSVLNRTRSESSNTTNDITVTHEQSIDITNGTSSEAAMNNSAATLQIPFQSLHECAGHASTSPLRVAYFVFFTNSLFNVTNPNLRIVPLITAARVNCSDDTRLSKPISISINIYEEDSEQADCASWVKGPWSTSVCQTVQARGELIRCECYQFSHFGVLLEETPIHTTDTFRVTVFLYFAVSLYLLLLALAIIFYTAAIRIRTSWQEIVNNITMTLAKTLTYVFFLIGAHFQSSSASCGVVSGFLQLFILISSNLMLNDYILLYLNLRGLSPKSKKRLLCFTLSTLLSWLLPVVIVSITAGVWYKYYHNEYYCGVIEQPLWFGLALPLVGVILVFHITFISLCFFKLIKHSSTAQDKSENCYDFKRFRTFIFLVLMSLTFFISWTFGLLSINPKLREQSNSLQVIFAIFTLSHGVLVFVYSILSNSDAYKFWTRTICFKSFNSTNDDLHTATTVTDASLSSTTSTSVITSHEPSADKETRNSSEFHIRLNKTKNDKKEKKFIPTETNQAYETVLSYNLKRHKYKITTNEAYASINTCTGQAESY